MVPIPVLMTLMLAALAIIAGVFYALVATLVSGMRAGVAGLDARVATLEQRL